MFLHHLPRSELGLARDFGARKVAEALAWFGANLKSCPNVADVSRAVHVSTTHLRRLFHKAKGVSPQSALTRVRLEHSKWLLVNSTMSIDEVARLSGYGDVSTFTRCFKQEFGVSPGAHRKKFRLIRK
jgi:transcriptional regulator GlxA family with amidase domain